MFLMSICVVGLIMLFTIVPSRKAEALARLLVTPTPRSDYFTGSNVYMYSKH